MGFSYGVLPWLWTPHRTLASAQKIRRGWHNRHANQQKSRSFLASDFPLLLVLQSSISSYYHYCHYCHYYYYYYFLTCVVPMMGEAPIYSPLCWNAEHIELIRSHLRIEKLISGVSDSKSGKKNPINHSYSPSFTTAVGGLNPSEKYQSIGMIIPNIWENKTCSKPPIRLVYFTKISSTSSEPNVIPLRGVMVQWPALKIRLWLSCQWPRRCRDRKEPTWRRPTCWRDDGDHVWNKRTHTHTITPTATTKNIIINHQSSIIAATTTTTTIIIIIIIIIIYNNLQPSFNI